MRYLALPLVILSTWLGGCDSPPAKPQLPAACETPIAGTAITFRFVAETQEAALLVTSPPDDIRRFVVEQQGRVKIITDTGLVTFLDVSDDIACCGEQGLLGLAFHPKYATNGRFFVFYTTSDANVIAEYKVSATDPNAADPASKKVVLSIDDFASNHNGGMMEFGPDGKLYVGTGDGGGGGDPNKNGQNPNAQLGKLLRIDVDAATPTPENYAIGLRNPWRWAFDPATGDLYIGDVGQGEIEELDFIPAGTPAGVNFGWNMYEGSNCFAPPCDATSKTMPVYEETHGDAWCSVIGGQVYRGSCYPDIVGTYFFTDYCKQQLVSAKKMGTTVGSFTTLANVSWVDKDGASHAGMPSGPSSLHQDARGELFLTTTGSRGGVYHLEAGP